MTNLAVNPFAVTKASDFSIAQIDTLWVDLADRRGVAEMAKPTSPMPMLILGGKGSGKTHLMRYFSYEAQCIRHKADVINGIETDGYLGIYLKCENLDASRFNSTSRFSGLLSQLFGYHLELSLSYSLLTTITEHIASSNAHIQGNFGNECKTLFDEVPPTRFRNIEQLATFIDGLRREVDLAVNNCSMSNSLSVPIRFSRGKLLFGLPDLIGKHFKSLRSIQFQYLIDELELLNATQQKHVNTFLRERRPHCSFKIGSRLYGIKTYETFNDNEVNKEGSEFETLKLDYVFRRTPKYKQFCRNLTARRIIAADTSGELNTTEKDLLTSLSMYFCHTKSSRFGEAETKFVTDRFLNAERPYFKYLSSKLFTASKAGRTPGLTRQSDIEAIVQLLQFPQFPLLEKANILFFHKEWSNNENLLNAAKRIASECKTFINLPLKRSSYRELISHFKGDLLCQLRKDCDLPQQYVGLETFITMSSGLPRNLLNILKHVFKWSIFHGEQPFIKSSVIGIESQVKGVQDAAEWFFGDAMAKGPEGSTVQQCISRLATMFRSIRFSDKPSECSLCTFSACLDLVSSEAKRNIELAENYSLLIRINKGQRDRNSGRIDSKYQINPMLSPLWDLPVSRRGAIALNTDEVNAIFQSESPTNFSLILNRRINRMMSSGFGKKNKTQQGGR